MLRHHQFSGADLAPYLEMFPLFPYELYGVGLPDLELMKHTSLAAGADRFKTIAWEQANIHAAKLGEVELARKLNSKKMDNGPYRLSARRRSKSTAIVLKVFDQRLRGERKSRERNMA